MTIFIALLALIAPVQQHGSLEVAPPERASPVGPQKPMPLTSPGTWITNRDYPVAARRLRSQGTVYFRVDVDANGVIVNCKILESSGSKILDQRTCELMRQRARWKPALDNKGQPMPFTWSSAFEWRL